MSAKPGVAISGVPRDLHEFYGGLEPLKRHDGTDVKRFAPYQVDVWNDRFKDHASRDYIRSPGVGLTRLFLMEALNVVLTSDKKTDVLIVVADQFTARRRRDELVDMVERSKYSEFLVRREDGTADLGREAVGHKTGIALRLAHTDAETGSENEYTCAIALESVIDFDQSSVNMHHVIILDVVESGFPWEAILRGINQAHSTTLLTRGTIVTVMAPRNQCQNLIGALPGINSTEPGELYRRGRCLARRIPTSIAIDAGIIERRDDNTREMNLMGKQVRDAKYPESEAI